MLLSLGTTNDSAFEGLLFWTWVEATLSFKVSVELMLLSLGTFTLLSTYELFHQSSYRSH